MLRFKAYLQYKKNNFFQKKKIYWDKFSSFAAQNLNSGIFP